MIVLDASAAVEIVRDPAAAAKFRQTFGFRMLHAPHLIDLEVLQVFRRFTQSGEVSSSDASEALDYFRMLFIRRHSHQPLFARIWQLRENLTAYDAAYVALAEALDAPLVTFDSRLARSSGHRATIELLAR